MLWGMGEIFGEEVMAARRSSTAAFITAAS
jgi:hypothetical protein